MSSSVSVPVPAGGGTAGGVPPTPSIAVPAGGAVASGTAPIPTFIVASAVLYVIGAEPAYHLPADHHDPIAYGVEVGLAVAVLFVGGKLVAQKVFRL